MQTWIDFTDIKRSVAIASLLRQYRVPLRRSGRDQYRGCCPIHGGEGRDAFQVNLTKNVFHCFACGAGGTVLDLVAAMEHCSLREAALKLASQDAAPSPLAPAAPTQLVTKKSKPLSPLGFTLRRVDSTHPYLVKRGIEIATAERFGVGFYSGSGILSGRLVIPLHDEKGRLVAYCGRAVDATEPRYRFPSGFAKSELLFNLHRALASGSSSVVVVEGFFDCFKLHQAGVHSVVALMGSALYETQQRALLQHFQRVVLMLDGDAAGRRATAASANRLRSHCTVDIIHVPETMQPDQMSSDQIRYVLKACRLAATIGPVQ